MIEEAELIIKLKKGDRDAFRFFIDRYKDMIHATITHMIGHCNEVEDIAQESFIRFFKSVKSFKGEAKLSTYLSKIAMNLSLNELKRRQKRIFMSIDDSEDDGIAGVALANDKQYEDQEIIRKALERIDADYKSVLILRLIDAYSTKETAKILNIAEGTVLSRLSRGQQKLREQLKNIMGEHL